MPLGQRFKLCAQERAGNVDRHVLRRPHRGEQPLGLGAVAGAQVDQRAARSDPRRDLVGAAIENGLFVPRQRVLGQFADRLEQPRAERVIEELRRDRGCRSGKSGAQLGGRVGAGRQQIDKANSRSGIGGGHAAV